MALPSKLNHGRTTYRLCYPLYLPPSYPPTTVAILATVLPWTNYYPAQFGSRPVPRPLVKGSFSQSRPPPRPESFIGQTWPGQFSPTSENGWAATVPAKRRGHDSNQGSARRQVQHETSASVWCLQNYFSNWWIILRHAWCLMGGCWSFSSIFGALSVVFWIS